MRYVVSIHGLTVKPETTEASSKEDAITNIVARVAVGKGKGFKYGDILISGRTIPTIIAKVLDIYRSGSSFVSVKEI